MNVTQVSRRRFLNLTDTSESTLQTSRDVKGEVSYLSHLNDHQVPYLTHADLLKLHVKFSFIIKCHILRNA